MADGTTPVVLGARDGAVRRRPELPSSCTALTTAPGGEPVVGTRNGLILFDRP
ncbi:hypothetical protein [Streptomyces sp. NPDC000983]|uniref:hypothetical protein n=1 Tax=Streptomyces sp. NPDC000983 TaxID=3154373 RepID=UPI0033254DA5